MGKKYNDRRLPLFGRRLSTKRARIERLVTSINYFNVIKLVYRYIHL